MKKLLISFALLLLPVVAFADGMSNRAEWRFSKSDKYKPKVTYLETGLYPTVDGIKEATLSFRHKGKLLKPAVNEKGYPSAESKKGDYWLLEVPTGGLESGTVVDIFLPFTGNEG